jgi:hypothetical protein
MLQLVSDNVSRARSVVDFADFFEGRSFGCGVVENRFGTIKREMSVEFIGTWRDDHFLLNEQFVYPDTGSEHRQWRLHRQGTDQFSSNCAETIGEGRLRVAEFGFTHEYVIRLMVRDWRVKLRFREAFITVSADKMLYRAVFSKWGIRLGAVSILVWKPR